MKRLVILIFLYPIILVSQVDTTSLQVIGKIDKEGKLKIRWFVESNAVWLEGLTEGYVLEKVSNSNTINNDANYNRIAIVNKWEEDQLNKALAQVDPESLDYKYMKMSYDLSKTRGALTPNASFEEVLDFKEELDLVYGYAMISSLMSWEAAKIQGMAFESKDYTDDDVYRVSLNSKIKGLEILPAYLRMQDLLDDLDYIEEIEVMESHESIGLSWKKEPDIFASFTEYSEDGINFISNSDIPSILLSTTDQDLDSLQYSVDSLENGKLYYFKVYGQTVFGDRVLIGEAQGIPRDKIPPHRPVLLQASHVKPELIEINWKAGLDEDLAGYTVGRATEAYGQYYQIHEGLIPLDRTKFYDKYFNKDSSNYYVIEAIDNSGNRSRSNFVYVALTDSIPPETPVNITGIMDSIGIVTLKMEPQEERDFMGYRIYFANKPDTEFSVIQETYNDTIVENARNPILIDTSTIESLSPYVYYKVGALDYHYNESALCETIKVKRPDIYPPVPPKIIGYKAYEDRISFEIALSTSFDVRQNYIYRKEVKEENWTVLDSLGTGFDSQFIDSTGEARVDYIYSLKAIDESGLESEFGNQLKLATYKLSNSFSFDIQVRYFENDNKTIIFWDYISDLPDDINCFKILIDHDEGMTTDIYRNLDTPGLVLDSEFKPNTVTVIPQSRKRPYAGIAEENIISENGKIENNEDYKKYAR